MQQDYTVDESGATLNAVSRSSDASEEQRLQQEDSFARQLRDGGDNARGTPGVKTKADRVKEKKDKTEKDERSTPATDQTNIDKQAKKLKEQSAYRDAQPGAVLRTETAERDSLSERTSPQTSRRSG